MDLVSIRKILEDYENQIIWGLIQRSKFPLLHQLYTDPKSNFYSLLEKLERVYQLTGKYTAPHVEPFSKLPTLDLGNMVYHTHPYNQLLESDHTQINYNPNILSCYHTQIIPTITNNEKQLTNISIESVIKSDLDILELISQRCHLGKMVASIKFREQTSQYRQCKSDTELLTLLTNSTVETKILDRIQKKLQLFNKIEGSYLLDVEKIKKIFIAIMQITKQIQVDYLKLII